MWTGFFTLLSLGTLMAVASFLAGSLPLALTLSSSRTRLISALGSGVLVGTSMVVIIPEGVETLYGAVAEGRENGHGHDRRHFLEDSRPSRSRSVEHATLGTDTSVDEHEIFHLRRLLSENEQVTKLGDESSEKHEESDHVSKRQPHAWVGLSLILGFILMYLIDQLPRQASRRSQARQQPMHFNLASLSQGLHRTPSAAGAEDDDFLDSGPRPPVSRSLATTVGLVIHATADGVALGASSSLATSNLGFIVFLAIMIHKAPAAFGLTSVLLKEGLSKKRARAHLLIFSLAAPLGALLTWSAINVVGRDFLGGDDGTKFATGTLLLFSGGTFLYVAMHTMQEQHAVDEADVGNGYANGYAAAPQLQAKSHEGSGLREVLAAVAGMLVPLLTQISHTH